MPHRAVIDRERRIGIALLQRGERGERGVPGDMPVEDAAAVIFGKPSRDQCFRFVVGARLEHGVGQRVRAIGVLAAQLDRAFQHRATARDLTIFRQRPAPIGEEPPVVVGKVRGVALAQIDLGLIVFDHAGEGEQAESADRQRG
ncbi:hypothetical protein ACFSHP_19205 [Novosphingobium panipatense]